MQCSVVTQTPLHEQHSSMSSNSKDWACLATSCLFSPSHSLRRWIRPHLLSEACSYFHCEGHTCKLLACRKGQEGKCMQDANGIAIKTGLENACRMLPVYPWTKGLKAPAAYYGFKACDIAFHVALAAFARKKRCPLKLCLRQNEKRSSHCCSTHPREQEICAVRRLLPLPG